MSMYIAHIRYSLCLNRLVCCLYRHVSEEAAEVYKAQIQVCQKMQYMVIP